MGLIIRVFLNIVVIIENLIDIIIIIKVKLKGTAIHFNEIIFFLKVFSIDKQIKSFDTFGIIGTCKFILPNSDFFIFCKKIYSFLLIDNLYNSGNLNIFIWL